MLDTVVVGLDGSETSDRVLAWCTKAFSKTTTQVVIVTACAVRPALGEDANEELRAELRPVVALACKSLEAAGIGCRGEVVDGDARTALLDTAEKVDADLIIVGSRGHSPLADLMLGSCATYLTHHSPLPVVVVR